MGVVGMVLLMGQTVVGCASDEEEGECSGCGQASVSELIATETSRGNGGAYR